MVTNTKKKKAKTAKKKATKKKVVKKKTIKNNRGKDIPAPNPVGRPTDYDPKYCDVVIEEMAKGYSKEAVAGYIGISKSTLYQWAKDHDEFSNAISIGESKSQRHWENKLVDHAVHTKNGKQINGQVFNLNMKNRFGWKDKQEISADEATKKSFGFALDQKPEEIK